jgi:putative endonuclease
MAGQKHSLGRWGEERAAEYLAAKGYKLIGRNLRTEYGEIDLLAQIDETLVFVEVKTRSSHAYGYPEESVSALKQQHMADAAESYLQNHAEQQGEWRVDVIAVTRRVGKEPLILHLENALAD